MIIIRDNFVNLYYLDKMFDYVANQGKDIDQGTFFSYDEIKNCGDSFNSITELAKILCKLIWIEDKNNNFLIKNTEVEKFEIWNNCSDLGYHLDKDEDSPELKLPFHSSVLYIGPENISGGDLMINVNGPFSFFKNPDPTDFSGNEWIKVPFRRNRLVLFSSTYPHLVTKTNDLRISFAFNVWHKR